MIQHLFQQLFSNFIDYSRKFFCIEINFYFDKIVHSTFFTHFSSSTP